MSSAPPLEGGEGRATAGGGTGERTRLRLALAGTAAVLLALAHPLLTGEVYVHDDLGALHLPLRDFFARCLAEGQRFLWMPGWLTGFHLHGEGQAGLFHPLNLLSYWALPLSTAFMLELVRNHVIAFAGMYWFLRRASLPRDAAALGAIAFGLSSQLFAHHMHLNAMGAVAHAPWMMGAVDGVMRRSGRGQLTSTAGLALLIASALLLGHPQFVWIALLASGLYAGFVLLQTGRWASVSWLAVAALLGLLCAGVQLVPTLETLAASTRSEAAPGFASTLALAPVNLLQITSPLLFGGLGLGEPGNEFAIHPGTFAPLAFIWLALRGRQLGTLAPLAIFSVCVAGIGLWLALGDSAGLHRLLSSLPGIGLLRAPTRYAFLFALGSALASAVCLADVARLRATGRMDSPERLWALGLPIGGAVFVAAAVIVGRFLGRWPDAPLSSTPMIVVGCAMAGVALLGLLAAIRGQRHALAAIVVWVTFDLGSQGLAYVWRVPPMTPRAYTEQWRTPKPLGDERLNWGPPAMVMNGVRLASGYVALTPNRRLPIGRFEAPERGGGPGLGAALRVAGVGWAYARAVPDPLPRVRMLSTAERIDDLQKQLAEVDLRRVVLLEEAVSLGGGSPGEAVLLRDEPGEVEISTQAETRQMLVLSESHHPGWVARVDGRECALVRAYGDFMGCVVEAGRHQVVFRFEPRSLARGAVLSAAGFSGVMALGLVAWRRGD
jgi:hypothetical protein